MEKSHCLDIFKNRWKAGLLILTQHVKVLSIQAFAEVEKPCFFFDLEPIIFMSSSRNDEILAQMEVGDFLRWILQGMDAQERHSCWLINVDILKVLLPGEVQPQGHCKGRHTRQEVSPAKRFCTGVFLTDVFSKETKHSLRSKEALKKDVEKGRSSSSVTKYSFTSLKQKTQSPKIWHKHIVYIQLQN